MNQTLLFLLFLSALSFGPCSNAEAQSQQSISTDLHFLGCHTPPDIIVLKSTSPPYQVTIQPHGRPRRGYFIDAKFEEGRKFGPKERPFEFVKFEKKVVPDPMLGEKDVSEMTLRDSVRESNFVLVLNVEFNFGEKEAQFTVGSKTFSVPVGRTFQLEQVHDTTFKVVSADDDRAVLVPIKADGTLDKEIEIKKVNSPR